MAKSIKDVGSKVEKKLSAEVAKKEGEILKEALSSLPSGAKVRVLKIEDGVKKYITTVGIDEYDKTDPYAWLKRRFAKKYGDGEYIVEFISSDGEVISQSPPIIIEVEVSSEKKIIKEEEEFLRKINEALKIKEEAIEQKERLADEKAKVETEKARTVIELAEKQIDMLTRLYEEKIKLIEERFKKSDDTEMLLLMSELNKIRDEYNNAIQNIERTIEKVMEEKRQPEYMDILMQFMMKSMEKDSFEEMMKMMTFIKQLQPDTKEKKDFFEELIENPQKMELFKKVMGIDSVEEIRREISDLFRYAFEKNEQEPKKDLIDETLENFEKMRRLKEIIQPVLGINPQPAKSFVELVATILQSPQVPHVVNAIVEGMTRAKITEKMIEQGYIPVELAGHFVKPSELPENSVKHKQTKKQKKQSEEEMIKAALINSIQAISSKIKPETTEEEFAKMIAQRLIEMGEKNKMLAATIVFMDKNKRKSSFVRVMMEIMPDITEEQANSIYNMIEKEIEKYIKQKI